MSATFDRKKQKSNLRTSSPNLSHNSPHVKKTHTPVYSSPSITPHTSLALEVLEMKPNSSRLNDGSVVHTVVKCIGKGSYQIILEVVEGSSQIWRQKTHPQELKNPILFGDYFKVKPGDGQPEIKAGAEFHVSLVKEGLVETVIDQSNLTLDELRVNTTEAKTISFDNKTADLTINLTLSNTHYPRNSELTLKDIGPKEEPAQNGNQLRKSELNSQTSLGYSAKINVKFGIHYNTFPGEIIKIVGSDGRLGSWDIHRAPTLNYENGYWTTEISFGRSYLPVEYKYAVFSESSGSSMWESCGNRKLEAGSEDFILRNDSWNSEN